MGQKRRKERRGGTAEGWSSYEKREDLHEDGPGGRARSEARGDTGTRLARGETHEAIIPDGSSIKAIYQIAIDFGIPTAREPSYVQVLGGVGLQATTTKTRGLRTGTYYCEDSDSGPSGS